MDTSAFVKRMNEIERGDRHMAVTPSFIVLGIAAGFIFTLSHFAFAANDTLQTYVPRDSGVYLHNNHGATTIVPIPDYARNADEVAVFAILDDTLDTSWGTLISWHDPRSISDVDTEKLNMVGARTVSRGVWFVGSEPAGQKVDQVARGADSISNDIEIKRALGLMRSAYNFQGYLNFNLLPPDMLPETLAPLHELEALVFGLSENGSIVRAVGQSVRDASGSNIMLGFGAPNASENMSETLRNALLSVDSASAIIDPINLLFRDIEDERIVAEYPETKTLEDSMSRIRLLLSGQTSFSVMASIDEIAPPKTVALVQGVSLDDLKAAIESYVAAAFPETSSFSLPDKDTAIEFKKPSNPPLFVLKDTSDIAETWQLDLESIGSFINLTKTKDGRIAIGSDETGINELLDPQTSGSEGKCLIEKYPYRLTVKNPELLNIIGLINLDVGQAVDNVVLACGLKK